MWKLIKFAPFIIADELNLVTTSLSGLNYFITDLFLINWLKKVYTHVIFILLVPPPLCRSPKEALSLPDSQGINLEADTDQLWQSATSTSALSAQRARCPSRLSGHGDQAYDGLSAHECAGSRKWKCARVPVRASSRVRVLHFALCLQPGFSLHWCFAWAQEGDNVEGTTSLWLLAWKYICTERWIFLMEDEESGNWRCW